MWRGGVVAVVICLALAGCGGDTPVTGSVLMGSHTVDRHREMPYLLWLPDSYDAGRQGGYPLIVSLHGTGQTQYSPGFVVSHGLPAVLAQSEQPEGFDFVVLAPQGLDQVHWWQRGQPAELNEIVDTVVDELAIDESRVYLTGYSTGGQGAWHVANRYPNRYAAVVSIAGSGFMSTGPLDEGSCGLADVPIWAIHGEDDLISVYEIVRSEVDQWETLCDAEVRWTSYAGVGHYEAFEIAYRDPAIYEWLRAQQLG